MNAEMNIALSVLNAARNAGMSAEPAQELAEAVLLIVKPYLIKATKPRPLDPCAEAVQRMFDMDAPRGLWEWKTPTGLYALSGLKADGYSQNMFGRALTAAGFARRKAGGTVLILTPPLRKAGR